MSTNTAAQSPMAWVSPGYRGRPISLRPSLLSLNHKASQKVQILPRRASSLFRMDCQRYRAGFASLRSRVVQRPLDSLRDVGHPNGRESKSKQICRRSHRHGGRIPASEIATETKMHTGDFVPVAPAL
jgi:hypothetical protein